MQLDFETIKSVTFGAVRVWQTDGGAAFSRHTEGEEAAWRAAEEVFGVRAVCTAGVRLDFVTDATAVALHLSEGDLVDVWINGIFRRQISFSALREAKQTARFTTEDPLGDAHPENRVTIWMPSHSRAVLSDLSLENATYVRRADCRHRLLFHGDSITHGWNSGVDSMAYVPRVARFFDADYVNTAVGGGYFLPETLEPNGFDPEAVVIAFGTNDYAHWPTPETLRQQCAAYLDKVRALYEKRPVFVITPIYRGWHGKGNAGTLAECRAAVAGEATARDMTVVDGLTLVPPLEAYFAGDGLHPNERGFACYAENLIKVMQNALQW